jgi:hypothetical protein
MRFTLRFGCFFFQRRKRSALKRNVLLTRPSIGQSLPNDALRQLIGGWYHQRLQGYNAQRRHSGMRPLGRRPGIQTGALFWIPGSLA